MTNLLNSLLDISRLDAGAITPEWEEFPIQRLIDRLSAEFRRQASHKGLQFSASACTASVRSDPNLLSEIVQNLVSNAIRYTENGEVNLRCVETGDSCRLEVEDTGIGIEPDQIDEIFKEFHQCKTTGTAKEGFGLGLAIVRRLSELLSHDVTVISEPGNGSCFSVNIPTVAVTSASGEAQRRAATPEPDAASGLVLLIEDDVAVANAWGLLLEAEGYHVATAATASDAQAIAEQLNSEPVLLISDYHLLDQSTGVEAVNRIRQHYGRSIPTFIVSGDTSKVVTEARPLDNCTIMNKPIDTDRLLRAARIATETGRVPAD